MYFGAYLYIYIYIIYNILYIYISSWCSFPHGPSMRTLKTKIINRATMAPKPPDPDAPPKSIPWGVRCRDAGDGKLCLHGTF